MMVSNPSHPHTVIRTSAIMAWFGASKNPNGPSPSAHHTGYPASNQVSGHAGETRHPRSRRPHTRTRTRERTEKAAATTGTGATAEVEMLAGSGEMAGTPRSVPTTDRHRLAHASIRPGGLWPGGL